jgi:hypothetical protein
MTEEEWIDSILWPGYLAGNLTVASALCRAFKDGRGQGYDDAAESEGYHRTRPRWHPGCEREAPR